MGIVWTVLFAVASVEPEAAALVPRNPAVEAAVSKALDYLQATQSGDGSWGGRGSSYSRHVGITGLCGMAFMSAGHLPGRGKHGKNVDDALAFVLSMVGRDGYIGTKESGMYGHGFAALFLGEVYGMSPRPELGRSVRLATELSVRAQKEDGGWRYEPVSYGYSDVSVTTCIIMSLRAARNAGVDVPKETIEKAVNYLRQCVNPDGGLRYMVMDQGESRPALTAAAVISFYGLGRYDLPEINRGVTFLENYHRTVPFSTKYPHYYYSLYYEAQAMYQVGGERWKQWYADVSSELIRTQAQDGSWSDYVGNAYATAMAALVLEVPYSYLPIFQR